MDYLFSENGLSRLADHVRPGVLCLFDFDGTLAPIVEHHEHARLPSETRHLLQRLARHAPVGIITGRSVDDIRARIGFEPHFLVGNHGLEGLPNSARRQREYGRICRSWSEFLHDRFRDAASWQGIELEDKRYSLSVHYRRANHSQEIERRLEALFRELSPPPRVMGGKSVFNLLPEGAPDKGSAVQGLMRTTDAASAIYVGDDVTDEDVFRLRRDDIFSLRIGRDDSSDAQFYLRERDEIGSLLVWLIDRFDRAGQPMEQMT